MSESERRPIYRKKKPGKRDKVMNLETREAGGGGMTEWPGLERRKGRGEGRSMSAGLRKKGGGGETAGQTDGRKEGA